MSFLYFIFIFLYSSEYYLKVSTTLLHYTATLWQTGHKIPAPMSRRLIKIQLDPVSNNFHVLHWNILWYNPLKSFNVHCLKAIVLYFIDINIFQFVIVENTRKYQEFFDKYWKYFIENQHNFNCTIWYMLEMYNFTKLSEKWRLFTNKFHQHPDEEFQKKRNTKCKHMLTLPSTI